jgi:putative tryptophan/tyrosine transport system substrate-binding protein
MNNRRKFIVALGATSLAAPFVSFAQQQGKVWRVGFLAGRHVDSLDSDVFGAFPRGMRELGYVEGKNLVIEWLSAEGKYERLPELAAKLVQLKVDVIVAPGPPAISAAQKVTTTVPIVMANASDPVGSGFVKSLARPGGNITGLSDLSGDLNPKHLEMLLGIVPKLTRVAVLVNFENPSHALTLKSIQLAAQKSGVTILPAEARTPQEIETAFSMMTRQNAGAIIVPGDARFTPQYRQIAELAAKNRLPTISPRREYVEVGGLMSYGQNVADNFRRAAMYVDKIFKGAKPGDLPVEQPTKFELFINGKTAKALGLRIPQSLLISADKVIE